MSLVETNMDRREELPGIKAGSIHDRGGLVQPIDTVFAPGVSLDE